MISDPQLTKDCRAAIRRLGPHPDVQVMVSHGWVSIMGSVVLGPDRWKVEQAVARVAGVVGANAQLSVRPAHHN